MAETAYQTQTTATSTNLEKKGVKDKSMGFFNEVAKEMRKVSWPKRSELQDATVITLAVCVIFSAFVFGIDKIFEIALRGLYSLVG